MPSRRGPQRANRMERETGFEPATSTLARSHSTTELLPRETVILMDLRVLSSVLCNDQPSENEVGYRTSSRFVYPSLSSVKSFGAAVFGALTIFMIKRFPSNL